MIYLHPGSCAYELIRIVALTGEFPFQSLSILGSERSWKDMAHKLNKPQDFQIPGSYFRCTCRMLTISGKGKQKSIRLYKRGLPLLEAMFPEGHAYYMEIFGKHVFSGSESHVDRNHRIAESIAMLNRAGIQTEPYRLPKLQAESFLQVIPDFPCMYHSRDIKMIGTYEQKKHQFTRLVGAAFADRRCYAIYNTRDKIMKWTGQGEEKAKDHLNALCRMNAGIQEADAAILFGADSEVAKKILLMESERSKKCRFDSIFHETHFIPMNAEGIRMLRLMMLPNARENLLSTLFTPDIRSYDLGGFEYDAKIGDRYIFSHIDGDICRLLRFLESVRNRSVLCDILCTHEQKQYLEKIVGNYVNLHELDLSELEGMIMGNIDSEDE